MEVKAVLLSHVLLCNLTVFYTCEQTQYVKSSGRPACSHMQWSSASHWLSGGWWLSSSACLGGPVCVLFCVITGAVWAGVGGAEASTGWQHIYKTPLLSALMENYCSGLRLTGRALRATAQLIREECEQVFHLGEQFTFSQWGGGPGLELSPHRIASFLAGWSEGQRKTRTSQLGRHIPLWLITDRWL